MRDIQDIRRANTRKIIEESFGNQTKLGEALGKSSSEMTRYLKADSPQPRSITSSFAREIERAGGKPENWLDQDHDSGAKVKKISDLAAFDAAAPSNVSDARAARGRLPIISWVIAGQWAEIEDFFLPPEDYKYIETTENLSEREAIALEVEGYSMYNPEDPKSFPPGSIIIVKRPDLRQPRSGDFVVVRLDNEHRSTFKQLFFEGDKMVLKPLNPDPVYKTIILDRPATLIGVVTEKVIRTIY